MRSPKIGDNGLSCWEPMQSVDRDGKLFRPDDFAKSKEGEMSPEIIDCRLNTLVDLYLFNTWIALYIEDAIAGEQIFIEFLRAANIQNRISRLIKLTDFS